MSEVHVIWYCLACCDLSLLIHTHTYLFVVHFGKFYDTCLVLPIKWNQCSVTINPIELQHVYFILLTLYFKLFEIMSHITLWNQQFEGLWCNCIKINLLFLCTIFRKKLYVNDHNINKSTDGSDLQQGNQGHSGRSTGATIQDK